MQRIFNRLFKILFALFMVGCGDELRMVEQVDKPIFDPPPGVFEHAILVTIKSPMQGADIRYTVDGSEPTRDHGYLYTGPVMIYSHRQLKAVAILRPLVDSEVTSGDYWINIPQADPPTFDPAPGDYIDEVNVAINSTNIGSEIRYTLDGSEPSETSGTVYSGPIKLKSGRHGRTETIKAIALVQNMIPSPIAQGTYRLTASQVSPPIFDPPQGEYVDEVEVSLTTSTPAAEIRYTLNGSEPSETNGTVYSGPIKLKSKPYGTETVFYNLKAIAYRTDLRNSEVVSATYTMAPPGRCEASNKFKCVAGKGELADYIPNYQNHFNNQARWATPQVATWCVSGRVWHQDWLGAEDDNIWLCDPDSDKPYAYWQDEQGKLVREAWLHICSFERIARVNGTNLVKRAQAKGWVETNDAICQELIASDDRNPQEGGAMSYWEVHEFDNNTTKIVYWLKKRNNP